MAGWKLNHVKVYMFQVRKPSLIFQPYLVETPYYIPNNLDTLKPWLFCLLRFPASSIRDPTWSPKWRVTFSNKHPWKGHLLNTQRGQEVGRTWIVSHVGRAARWGFSLQFFGPSKTEFEARSPKYPRKSVESLGEKLKIHVLWECIFTPGSCEQWKKTPRLFSLYRDPNTQLYWDFN